MERGCVSVVCSTRAESIPNLGSLISLRCNCLFRQVRTLSTKAFFNRVRQAVSVSAGIEALSFSEGLSILGANRTPAQADISSEKIPVGQDTVDSDYFDTIGVPIMSGRTFNTVDGPGTPKVAVINQKMADTFWPGKDAVGKSFLKGEPAERFVVIGVIDKDKYGNIDEAVPPMMYRALSQNYGSDTNLVVRTAGNPRFWVNPLRQAVSSVATVGALPSPSMNGSTLPS